MSGDTFKGKLNVFNARGAIAALSHCDDYRTRGLRAGPQRHNLSAIFAPDESRGDPGPHAIGRRDKRRVGRRI